MKKKFSYFLNVLIIVIISVVSIVFSAREYEKKKKADLLNNKNT